VFLLTGMWHGASWNFVIWGLIHGVFIVIERLGFDKLLGKSGILQNIYTLFVVIIAWVFFRIEGFGDACGYITRMFVGGENAISYDYLMFLSLENTIILIIAVMLSFNGFEYFKRQTKQFLPNLIKIKPLFLHLKTAGLLVLFVYSIMSVASGSYNPFIYFRF
jgi:alginate O-acetyltransferase complex protein AlgI